MQEGSVEYTSEDDTQRHTHKEQVIVENSKSEDDKMAHHVVGSPEAKLPSSQPITADLKSYLEDHDSSNINLDELKSYIEMLQDKAQQFEEIQQANLPTRYQIVYRIFNDHGPHWDYLDHPEWVASGSPVIESRIPLENLELYLERNKDISFVVFRYFHHTQERKDEFGHPFENSRAPRHHWESICPVTKELGKTVESLLKQSREYSPMLEYYRMSQQIGAPYLFIYHNRERWDSILDRFPQSAKDQLDRLTDYVFEQFGRQYSLADKLFSQGEISIDLMEYLFKPGEILVSCVQNEHLGYIAESWPQSVSNQSEHKPLVSVTSRRSFAVNVGAPSINSSTDTDQTSDSLSDTDIEIIRKPLERKNDTVRNTWTVKAWRWGFDGQFKRQQEDLTIQFPLPKPTGREQDSHTLGRNRKRSRKTKCQTIKIEELNIYPIRFASQSIVKKLRHRGQMFWKCRGPCLVSYRDNENDYAENPVSDHAFFILYNLHSVGGVYCSLRIYLCSVLA